MPKGSEQVGAIKEIITCGAKRRNGQPCKKPGMANGRCATHGGKVARGTAHYNYKDGRWSSYAPTGLATKFEESMNDDRLMEIRKDVALVDARIKELLENLTSGESGTVWKRLQDAAKMVQAAVKAGDNATLQTMLPALLKTISQGSKDFHVWRDLSDQIDRRARLVSMEYARLVKMEQVITTERAMSIMTAVTQIVMRHVIDPTIRFAISQDIRAIVSGDACGADLSTNAPEVRQPDRLGEILPAASHGGGPVEDAQKPIENAAPNDNGAGQ